MPEKVLCATACRFRRVIQSGGGPWEIGIAISRAPGAHDVDVIIDKDGKPVKVQVWDYELEPYQGSFVVQFHKV